MRQKTIYIITVILSFFIGVGSILVINHFYPLNVKQLETINTVSVTETDRIKSSIDKVYDSVVVIESYKGNTQISSGSGFVYKKDDKKGYIITNYHVVDGSSSLKVKYMNGETVDANVLGGDEYSDIAVLSVDASSVLQVAEIGDSTKLELGDTLFTVGTPVDSDYMGTVTKGILSGKDRTVTVSLTNGSFMMEVLQTDAAINPGNSGGPLVNINGEVIGVNSLKLVQDEIEGMGFAIPIELVMSSVDRLEKGEEIKRPLLGVSLLDVDSTYMLYRNNIFLDESIEQGVVVVEVQEESTASLAELQKGDVILEIDGVQIENTAHFRFVLYKYNIGDKINVKYYRDKKISDVEIELKDALEG